LIILFYNTLIPQITVFISLYRKISPTKATPFCMRAFSAGLINLNVRLFHS